MAVPILIYHQIAPLPGMRIPFENMLVSPDAFRQQMHWLKKMGFQGMSVREALPFIRGEKSGRVAAITFDDGYRNVLRDAAPILAEYGFTATNYFVANQIGGSNVWDHALGIPDSPCMNVAELREWAALGHEVGAHTLDHVHLYTSSPEEARHQIVDCKKQLEDLVGQEVENFCYPYGENNELHRALVREAGYKTATTTKHARARANQDPFGLPRVYVKRKHSLPRFVLRCFTS